MDIKTSSTHSVKVPLVPIFLLFLILKLVGAVSWSWWLVTFPLWIVPAVSVCVLVTVVVVAVLAGIVRGVLGG